MTMTDDNHRCDCCCEHPRGHRPYGPAIFGLGLLAAGVLLTLDNVGVLDAGDFLPYWPVLLILLGLSQLVQPRRERRTVSGTIWVLVGAVLLLYNIDLIQFDVWDLWPLLIAFAGASLLWRTFVREKRAIEADEANTFHAMAVLGGNERRVTAGNFSGGSATAILGGCNIDLRDAASTGGPAVIDVFAFWGGVDIRVPQDWDVQVKGTAILGGFEDKTSTVNGDGKKVLIVQGTAIMGGVEIKH